jgi:hypothetical protein
MATPGDLVHGVADALGVPEATVVQLDRILADAGLRTKGGRGLSAAQVTSGDATNLLIAICGAPIHGPSVTGSLNTYNRYASLRAYHGVSSELGDFARLKKKFSTLGKLPPGHLFREGIAALINAVAAGEFDQFGRPSGEISVTFEGPIPLGKISIHALGARASLSYRSTANRTFSKKDLWQTCMFSRATISAVAKIVGQPKN